MLNNVHNTILSAPRFVCCLSTLKVLCSLLSLKNGNAHPILTGGEIGVR